MKTYVRFIYTNVCDVRMVKPMAHTATTPGRREWITLGVLVGAPLLVSMDITVLYFAIPSIAESLAPSSTQQLWMIDIYGFVLAGMLLTLGNLGDLIGRRTLLLAGVALFGLASAAAAFAPSAELLIAARALQGLGGAALMPSALALIKDVFPDDTERRKAIAIWSITIASGAALGPVISGLLLTSFWWGSIFLINVPVVLVLVVAIPVFVPNTCAPRSAERKFDLLSGVLSLASILAGTWGIKEAAVNGVTAAAVTVFVLGLALGAAFLYRQVHLVHPMVDLSLFRRPGFSPVLVLNLTGFFLVIGNGVFTTQYLLEVQQLSPLAAALWSMVAPLSAGAVVPVAIGLAGKVKPAYLVGAGFALAAVGFAVMTQLRVESPLYLVILGVVAIGAGTSAVFALITDLVLSAAPDDQTGSVAAMAKTFQELGGALGIAVLGTIGAAAYRSGFPATGITGVPAERIEAARQTIGGAFGAARGLEAEAAIAVLNAARVAFTTAVNNTAYLGIAVSLISVVLAVTRMRHLALPTPEQSTPKPVVADSAVVPPVTI